uniref:Uncharacterized protein n=1 Tax=Cacopsylla melanoneura TaxID=428564 RepID=A0A8D8S4G8_9HEMI
MDVGFFFFFFFLLHRLYFVQPCDIFVSLKISFYLYILSNNYFNFLVFLINPVFMSNLERSIYNTVKHCLPACQNVTVVVSLSIKILRIVQLTVQFNYTVS